MPNEAQQAEPAKPGAWKAIMAWVGGASAIIGLIASLSGGFTWFQNHHAQHSEFSAQMATAQGQAKDGQYEASVQTYATILKADPLNQPALDEQLKVTMQWVEDFHSIAKDDDSVASTAAPRLDEIFTILDAGLARAKGTQAADIQAHLGWAHWLNQKIAEREFGHTAEQDLHAALQTDPSNVYANAMLGNWMLQGNGNFADAIAHLNAAVATAKARPFVRSMQIGGMIYNDTKGARAAQIQAADDMRKNNEPLDEGYKSRILSWCLNPTSTSRAELVESLSAVPPDDAWKTYLWLDDAASNGDYDAKGRELVHDFIAANLLEISGKGPEALEKYRTLQQQLKQSNSDLRGQVDQAITRLSHS